MSMWLTSKMAEENEIDFPSINKVLPPEIFEIILEWLDIKSLWYARQTCKHWKQIIDNCKALSKISDKGIERLCKIKYVYMFKVIFFSFSEKISCIIIVGGYHMSSVEVLTGELGTKQLQNLPKEISGSLMVMHNGTVLLCGGEYNYNKCLQLDHGTWKEHSTLNVQRYYH